MSDPQPSPSPTAEQRRAAACLAMSKAPGLIRFAARYTRSLHDAEDALKRGETVLRVERPYQATDVALEFMRANNMRIESSD